MPKKTTIVIHHFASHWGNLAHCRDWHVNGNGWRDVGYHWIINNGYPEYSDYSKGRRRADWDGKIEQGRKPETSVAAGVSPQQHPTRNRDGIHVSLVGNFDTYTPTEKQMAAVIKLCAEICKRHDISPDNIYYHQDFANKSCPGKEFVSRSKFRQMVKDALKHGDKPELPKLLINGTVIENAYFVKDERGKLNWFAPRGPVSNVFGKASRIPDNIQPVAAVIAASGHKVVKTSNRLAERNRFDIRTEKG